MIDDPMNRLKVKRGSELPQSRLTEEDVIMVRELIAYRNKLLAEAKELTNAKIAQKFDVHTRTIDRISVGETWGHV